MRLTPIRHEHSVFNAGGLTQRKPFVHAYWADPDLYRRLGECADTFAEFLERVRRFQGRMETLADGMAS